MTFKVFIDGGEGTTGLKIHQYFSRRDDIELLQIDPQKRKDLDQRLRLIKKADITFLCLPDSASREIAAAAPRDARILDTSTAHRTNQEWVYGMPELTPSQRNKIRESNRVAVPGCHATGAILLIRPLIEAGLIEASYPFALFSLTGYSGGGKKMIEEYEAEPFAKKGLISPRQYGIAQKHKHLPEIKAMTGISGTPAFIPVVAPYYSGMEVTVPIRGSDIDAGGAELHLTSGYTGPKVAVEAVLAEYYQGQNMVKVVDKTDEGGFVRANRLAGTNSLEIAVEGNDENILLIASYDNLGKGASGAAIQNMNIMLGIEEEKGLI